MYETLSLSTGTTYAETKTYAYKNHTYRFTLNEQPGTSITAYIYIDGSKLTGSGQYLTARSNGTNGCAGNEYAAITDNAGGSVVYMLK